MADPAKARIRVTLHLPPEAYTALKQLQRMTGKPTLSETIRAALKVHRSMMDSVARGERLEVVGRDGDRTTIVFI